MLFVLPSTWLPSSLVRGCPSFRFFFVLLPERLFFFSSRTKTVEKDLSPEWDETFEFAVKDFTRLLEVSVLDADIVVDEPMGSITIKLEDFLHERRVRGLGLVVSAFSVL